jgi:hypothetical protein
MGRYHTHAHAHAHLPLTLSLPLPFIFWIGELTIEQYSTNLNTRISDEKRYAEYYEKKGNTKYRDSCLVRVKLMQEELAGWIHIYYSQ